jgi:hypothetical protein
MEMGDKRGQATQTKRPNSSRSCTGIGPGGTKALVRVGGTSSGNEGQEVDGEGSSRVYIQMPLLEIKMGVTTGR